MDREPPQPLLNQQVVVTGRFASMTHPELRSWIAMQGGRWRREVTGATQILAVGEDGPSVNVGGKLTRNLQRALQIRNGGGALEIVTEGELLRRLGLSDQGEAIRRTYSLL